MRAVIILIAVLVVAATLAGCTSAPVKSSYSVDNNGILSVTCAPVTTNETVLFCKRYPDWIAGRHAHADW